MVTENRAHRASAASRRSGAWAVGAGVDTCASSGKVRAGRRTELLIRPLSERGWQRPCDEGMRQPVKKGHVKKGRVKKGHNDHTHPALLRLRLPVLLHRGAEQPGQAAGRVRRGAGLA